MTVAAGIEVGAGIGAGAGFGIGASFGVGGGIEAGAESAAGGRAGAGLGTGRSQTTVSVLDQGRSAGWPGAAKGTASPSSVSSGASFRANWQAMLRTWGVAPRADSGATDTDASGTGEIDTENEANEREGVTSVPAHLLGTGAEAAARSLSAGGPATGQGNGPVADATGPLVYPQSAASVGNATTTPRLQMSAAASGVVGVSAQTLAVPAAEHATSSTDTAGSVKSGRRESDWEGTKTRPSAGSANNGPLATANVLAAAAVVLAPTQAQVMPADLPAAATSGLADRSFGPASEAVGDAGRAWDAAITGTSGVMVAAGTIAARPGATAWVRSGTSTGAAQSVPQDEEASGVMVFPLSEPSGFAADRQTPLPPAMGAPTEKWPAANAGPCITESGSRLAQGLRAPATETGAHRGDEGNSAGTTPSPAVSSSVDNPSAESDGLFSQQTLGRAVHGAAAGVANSSTAHIIGSQSTGAATDAAPWVRDPAGAPGMANAAAAVAAGSTGTPVTAAGETFTALDAGTAVGTPGWIHAGGQRAEAGFQDPALGWVGVRADLNGRGIHAAVVPGSPEAAQALSGHLAALSAYLAEQQTPVATLTMTSPGGSGMGAGVSQDMQQSAGQNTEQNSTAASQAGAQQGTNANPSGSGNITGESGGFDAMTYAGERRGTHISVMA